MNTPTPAILHRSLCRIPWPPSTNHCVFTRQYPSRYGNVMPQLHYLTAHFFPPTQSSSGVCWHSTSLSLYGVTMPSYSGRSAGLRKKGGLPLGVPRSSPFSTAAKGHALGSVWRSLWLSKQSPHWFLSSISPLRMRQKGSAKAGQLYISSTAIPIFSRHFLKTFVPHLWHFQRNIRFIRTFPCAQLKS